MNTKDRYLPLFASHVFQLYIDYDTDALLTDTSWIYSANQDRKNLMKIIGYLKSILTLVVFY